MTTISFKQQNESVEFHGELTRETIDKRFEKKTVLLLSSTALALDFANVGRIDMAGLAWLLILVEQAQKQTCDLSFKNTPESLLKLAKLSSVDSFLPIK